jgi:hypothetical protein
MVVESQSRPRGESSSPPAEQAPPPAERNRTRTDGLMASVWLGDDKVVQLRQWATDNVYALPDGGVTECVIGSEPSADLQLCDPKGLVSRRHARLVGVGGGLWELQDVGSKNGIRLAGERRSRFLVAPGIEIGIGSFTLVAENQTLVRLRSYLARVLGWEPTRRPAIDTAMRAIRAAATQRAPLSLAGADDLVAIARQIHRHTATADAPFVVCGRRQRETDLSLRVTATYADPAAALERAAGGTVCVRVKKPPWEIERLVEAARDPRAQAQLMICGDAAPRNAQVEQALIRVPALARRDVRDIERLVAEYALDAIRELGAVPTSFTEADCAWVARHEATAFADIEIATLRIVARKDAGNVHQAAARLGLSHVGLGDWFKRRGLLQ